jgi:hypothetical protein
VSGAALLLSRGAGFRRVAALLGAAGALVVAAWFGLGVHQAVSQDHAEALIGTPGVSKLTAGEAGRVSSLLASAGVLNPDRSVALDRSAVALARGRLDLARRLARSVTSAEPQNIEAWVALARASDGDPALFRYALGRAAALEPIRPS